MTKIRKKYDKGIRLDPSEITGTVEGELWVDSRDDKMKIFLDGTVQEFNTTSATTAASISYDNSASGLTSTNLQAVIDEIKLLIDNAEPQPAVATALIITQQPPSTAGSYLTITPGPILQIVDQFGAPFSLADVEVRVKSTLGAFAEDVIGSNALLSLVDGTVPFDNIFFNKQITTNLEFYTLDTGLLTSATSNEVVCEETIISLSITQQPPSTIEPNVTFTPAPVIQILDQFGAPFALPNIEVRVKSTEAPFGTDLIGSNAIASLADGTVPFDDIRFEKVTTANLEFYSPLTGFFTPIISNQVVCEAVVAPIATALSITQQPPSTAVPDINLAPPITLQIVDQFGAPFSLVDVEVLVKSTEAPFGTDLIGSNQIASLADGTVIFDNIRFDKVTTTNLEFYTLDTGLLTSATSNEVVCESPVVGFTWQSSGAGTFSSTDSSVTKLTGGAFIPNITSVEQVVSGDMSVSFEVVAGISNLNMGIQDKTINTGVGALDTSFSFFAVSIGDRIRVYEQASQVFQNASITYGVGDILKIEIVSGDVNFYINQGSGNILLYTSTTAPTYPLFIGFTSIGTGLLADNITKTGIFT